MEHAIHPIAKRFRGFLPVVVDLETGGFDPINDALLEIAMVIIDMDPLGYLYPKTRVACHVSPFPGANLDPKSLAFNGIDPDNPLRNAISEAHALTHCFTPVREALKETGCHRAILVGHNAFFDMGFMNAAIARTGCKRNPFHPFSTLDTVTLGALAAGHTVLARSAKRMGMDWDNQEAHSAIYDAEQTADLFCRICNIWERRIVDKPWLKSHE
jgi:ribonuclease T